MPIGRFRTSGQNFQTCAIGNVQDIIRFHGHIFASCDFRFA